MPATWSSIRFEIRNGNMYSTIFLLMFMAFFLLYNRSKRVKIGRKPGYLVRLEQHTLLSRLGSAGLSLASLGLLIRMLGTGSGIFGFIVILMCVGSLVVVLAPFRYLRAWQLAAVYAALLLFEIFIF